MQTLLYGAQIITQNEQDEIHKEGWILLEDDRIIGIGAGAPPEVPEGTVKRCLPGRVIMPGIVNIHTHVGGTLFKGLTEDIKGAFYGLAFPMERFITRESMYSISMLGAMEAVKFGSTFIDDLYHFPESTARAAEELGLRGIIAQKIYDPDLQNLHNNDYSSVPGQAAQKLQANVDLYETFNGRGNGRIEIGFAPHATDTVPIALAKEIAATAGKYHAPVHTHVAQTPQEIAHDREAYGMTPVEYLFETGLAQQKLIAAHCVCVTENDVRLLAENKVHVAHCPEVFFKAGYFAPVDLWHKYGVTYALGTDWVTLNPWTNMRIYLGCWRTLGGLDEQQAGAKLAFRKITMDAARLVGKEKEIGSLEVGKKADLIVMDVREPHLQPMYDLDIRSTLVWNATGNEVETVIIDGKTIVYGKRVLTVDETAATQEATAICHKYLARQLGAQNQL